MIKMWVRIYSETNGAEHMQRFMTGKDVDNRDVMALEVTLHETDVLYIGKVYEGNFLQAVDDPNFPNRVGYNFINGILVGSHGRTHTNISPHDHTVELTSRMMSYLIELVDTHPQVEDNLAKCITELSQLGRKHPDRNKDFSEKIY